MKSLTKSLKNSKWSTDTTLSCGTINIAKGNIKKILYLTSIVF